MPCPYHSSSICFSVNHIEQNQTESAEEEDHYRIISIFIKYPGVRQNCTDQYN